MNKIEMAMIAILNARGDVVAYRDAIRDFGLFKDQNPQIYGEESSYVVGSPGEVSVFQSPWQLANLMSWLWYHVKVQGNQVGSYLEIGVFNGGTFCLMTTLLKQLNPGIRLLGIDNYDDPRGGGVHPDVLPHVGQYFMNVDSMDLHVEAFDMVFIDGDHSYDGVMGDWIKHGRKAKICVFHDVAGPVCPDVVRFWNELKGSLLHGYGYGVIEFDRTQGGGKNLGIGVVYRL